MSFFCDFPPYFKNGTSSLEFDSIFSLDLPTKSNSQSTINKKNIPKYINENEIKFNFEAQKNVSYIKTSKNFELTLQISGTTIFQDLIITARANNSKGDMIPIKCIWRRLRSEKSKKIIENVNSHSYMPNAQDLGFYIEVEVENLDKKGDIAVARYGPINLDRKGENLVEEMINYEKRCFKLVLCNEKVKNKNFLIELGKREIKLYNIVKDKDAEKKNLVERSKYSLVNPYIELSNTNINKFKISFAQLIGNNSNSNNDDNSDNASFFTEVDNSDIYSSDIKIKNEYEFSALSKQNRELIYVIIEYNSINIKIKNCKIFRSSNYNLFSSEIKQGILKLINELKIQKEQYLILQKNINYLEYVNNQLNEECTTLEENCKITMDKINGREPGSDVGGSELGDTNGNFSEKKNLNLKNLKNSEDEWKNKLNELKKKYNNLLAKEKANNDEKNLLINKDKNNLEMIEKNEEKIIEIKNMNAIYENEIKTNNKNLLLLNSDKLKIKKSLDDINQQLKLIKDKNNELKNTINDENEINNEKIKNEINEIKNDNENLIYENKNLILQKDMLTKQKNNILSEIEKIRNEKNIKLKNNQNNKNKLLNKKNLIENIQTENENLEKEYEKIKDDYQSLILDNINLKELYEKEQKNQNLNKVNMSSMSNNTIYQVAQEDYEEYEILKRNKDENEVIIMQLKNNNDILDKEIKELKGKINKKKNKKK